MGIWLEGRDLADKIKAGVKEEVAYFKEKTKEVPGLVGILVGDNKASQVYLRTKERNSRNLGIFSEIKAFPGDSEARFLKDQIDILNKREDVDGIIVQLPLPGHLNSNELISYIMPEKDVDGLHPLSLGKILLNQEGLRPCTPLGILELLKHYGITLEGKEAVVIGRSLLVGKSLAALLTNENATVTICHSRTRDLARVAARADILVAALGKTAFVLPEFVKPGAAVIDVGINSVSDKKMVEELFGENSERLASLEEKGYTLVGDVHPSVIDKAGQLTPVPGGVGLLTVAMLMKNTLEAFKSRRGLVYPLG